MRTPFRSIFFFSVALASVVARAQAAYVEYGGEVHLDDQIDSYVQYDRADGVTTRTLAVDGYGLATAHSFVGPGVNKAASAVSSIDAAQPVGSEYSFAHSAWFDTVTISDPNHDGEAGLFFTSAKVLGEPQLDASPDWVASTGSTLYANWWMDIQVDDGDGGNFQQKGWQGGWSKDEFTNGIEFYGDPLNAHEQEVSFEFTFGVPFRLSGLLRTEISATSGAGTLSASLDMGNSVYWGGMTLRDGTGSLVTGASLQSGSGMNYLTAVPEPSTFAALALGGAAVLRRRRR